jgi:hypothetical protein
MSPAIPNIRPFLAVAAVLGVFCGGLLRAAEPELPEAERESFEQKVRPILTQHCYSCHSHAGGKIKGGLSLDSKSGWEKGGDSGPAVTPRKPEKSLLIQAVRQVDADLKMPPKGKLSDAEIQTLSDWVARGAPDPRVLAPRSTALDWWSLQSLVRPAVPDGAKHPVDAFVLEKLRAHQLSPTREADRRSLIRRLSFDLHGLPPAPAEVEAFVADRDPNAYEKLVDRLLGSPQYGERWARHWLDVVRYGDSNGNEHDGIRQNAWRYRDYVIEAWNRDTPYARFVQEQLAADAFFPEQAELTAALGFLAAGPNVASGNANLIRDDYVATAVAAFTSMTVQCARCHHHKFDPISQEDYYGLQSVFMGVVRRDVKIDFDPKIRATRAKWETLSMRTRSAPNNQREPKLIDAEKSLLAEWQRAYHEFAKRWRLFAAKGEWLEPRPDGATFVARPDAESFVVRGPVPAGALELVRLELLTDPRLPEGGPGRGEKGAFSLNEINFTLHLQGKEKMRNLGVKSVVADASTKASPPQRAVDNKPETGWDGDSARQGKARVAVFALGNVPNPLPEGAELEITIQCAKSQGIGCFRWSTCGEQLSPYAVVPWPVAEAIASPAETRSEAQWLALAGHALPIRYETELKALPPATEYHIASGPLPLQPQQKMGKASILRRGEEKMAIGTAEPGALSCVTAIPARVPTDRQSEPQLRAWLADWLVHPENPLTWRSIVNRVWQHHFGVGIVDTPNDFGQMGGAPSHPELLNWLACEFRDGGGSLKKLHRLIVTSATYRQAVAANPAAEKIDAANRLLWRMNGVRLDAESYRDAVLAVSGRLDLSMGGPSLPQYVHKGSHNTTPIAEYADFDWGNAPRRRSIYRQILRTRPDPFMSAMDFPDASQFVPARQASISPLQALVLWNNGFVLRHCEFVAARIAGEHKVPEAQTREAFRLALQREPSGAESADFSAYIERHGLPAACRLLFNANEFMFLQ